MIFGVCGESSGCSSSSSVVVRSSLHWSLYMSTVSFFSLHNFACFNKLFCCCCCSEDLSAKVCEWCFCSLFFFREREKCSVAVVMCLKRARKQKWPKTTSEMCLNQEIMMSYIATKTSNINIYSISPKTGLFSIVLGGRGVRPVFRGRLELFQKLFYLIYIYILTI